MLYSDKMPSLYVCVHCVCVCVCVCALCGLVCTSILALADSWETLRRLLRRNLTLQTCYWMTSSVVKSSNARFVCVCVCVCVCVHVVSVALCSSVHHRTHGVKWLLQLLVSVYQHHASVVLSPSLMDTG